tara:strand:- start:413 stop:1495 length:1083 start_codon:yes stop_codon:yes gene_type:complete
MHHTVRLYPSQNLSLRLSSELRSLKTDPFIQITGETPLKEGIEVNFQQKSDVVSWGKESSVYLGEICGETTIGHKFRLCVYMTSVNDYKKDVVTVFNPIHQIIKLEPYQILEVVLSDPYFGGSDIWEIDFQDEERELDIGFHELGKREVPLSKAGLTDSRDQSDIYHLKSRTKDFYHPCCREHHYWLRFDNRMLPLVRTRSNKVYFIGHINFVGHGSLSKDDDLKAMRSLEVWLNIKNKHAHKVAQLLGVRDFGDVSEQPDSKVYLPIVSPKLRNTERKSRYSSRTYVGRHNNWAGADGYDYSGYSSYSIKKSVREIDIDEVENPILGINCKAKSLIPVGKKSTALIPYDWKHDDELEAS